MRAAFGLAGLLITVGVMIWILKETILPYNKTVIDEGNKAKEQAAQIAGIDLDSGLKHYESITMVEQTNHGRVESILVADIVPRGPMEKYFGLKRNDSIIAYGSHGNMMSVRDYPDGAKEGILTAYQEQQPLTIVRDGQRLTLPLPQQKTANANTLAQQPPKKTGGDAVQNQLDAIQKIPMH